MLGLWYIFITFTRSNPVGLSDHPRAMVQPLLCCTGFAYAQEKIPCYFPIQFREAEAGGREITLLTELRDLYQNGCYPPNTVPTQVLNRSAFLQGEKNKFASDVDYLT